MYIREAMSSVFAEVRPDELVARALDRVNMLHLNALPIVNNGQLVSLVKEDDLLSADESATLESLSLRNPSLFIYGEQHVYDAIGLMASHQLDMLPVVNKDHEYLGVITEKDIVQYANVQLSTQIPGAIIILELGSRDYSLSLISQIVESENAKILHLSTRVLADSDRLEITLKLNTTNISAIVASFWRFDINVQKTFHDGNEDNDIKDRYDLLMHYLDL